MNKSKPFCIDFFVIGAQKCATSWAYLCLKEHPQVGIPKNKIEHGYIGGELFKKRGEGWYFGRFNSPDKKRVVGDVAVDYMSDSSVTGILKKYTDNPKFIVFLRNPVDRMISAYFWSVRRNQLPNEPIETAFQPFFEQEPGFPERLDNEKLDELVTRGFYGDQLMPFIKEFDPNNFLIILYSEVKNKPKKVIKKLYEHLGVSSDVTPSSIDKKPKHNTYSSLAIRIERLTSGPIGAKFADYINRVFSIFYDRSDPISPKAREKLSSLFYPRIKKTQNVLENIPKENRPSNINLNEYWK